MVDDLESRFDDAVSLSRTAVQAGGDDLPHCLARAAVDALGVLGAAISVHDGDHRVPIGTSDAMAAHAERLQFTLGSGPAVDVPHIRRVVAADQAAIWRRWSPFAVELFAATPFRAVVTVPLSGEGDSWVTLDLYLDEEGLSRLRVQDAAAVADLVSDRLQAGIATRAAALWMLSLEANRRHEVWIAAGRLSAELSVSDADALDLLRARALTLGLDIDRVAAQVNCDAIAVTSLAPRADH